MIKVSDLTNWHDAINKVVVGDCLKLMAKLTDQCVDLVLTDPPYGIGMDKDLGLSTKKTIIDGDWDKKRPDKKVFDEIKRISKNQIIFGGNYFADLLPASQCWLIWDKKNGESTFADAELCWTSFNSSVRIIRQWWTGGASLLEDTGDKVHPTQKPKRIISSILQKYSERSTLIFDPFMGSWTTARACKDLGRRFIGCEISEKYCQIGEDRLRQENLI